ncbi:hypothetical protein SGLAM104S_00414 [Streptomyces glaucescens]
MPTYLKTERDLSVVGTGGYLTFLISGAFLGYLTGGHLTDRLGRRRNIWLFALLSAICILAYANIPSGANSLLLVLGFPLGFCMSAIFSGFGSFLSELYPTAVRGTGQGLHVQHRPRGGRGLPHHGRLPRRQLGRGRRAGLRRDRLRHRRARPPRAARDPRKGADMTGPRHPAPGAAGDRPLTLVDEHAHAWTPEAARARFRAGLTGPTAGVAAGHTQVNLISVPADWAYDMLLFCQRNPKPCPVLDVTDEGSWTTVLADGADLRTDLPRYRVWRDGELVDEPTDVLAHWRDDLVSVPDRVHASPYERALPAARRVLLDGLTDPRRVAADLTAAEVPPAPPLAETVVRIPVRLRRPGPGGRRRVTGVSPQEVARVHAGTEFRVALLRLSPRGLRLPHRDSHRAITSRAAPRPRTAVPAGAVGLAGPYTGVYPRSSPGGWQLIGRTDAVLWDHARVPAALLAPGTRVRFVPQAEVPAP